MGFKLVSKRSMAGLQDVGKRVCSTRPGKGVWSVGYREESVVYRAWGRGVVYLFFPYSFDASGACGNSRLEANGWKLEGKNRNF